MTQATDLFPFPPFNHSFLYRQILLLQQTPSTPSCILPASALLPPPHPPCAPRLRVTGRCNAGPILSLSETLKHPLASRQWYVAGSVHQTPNASAWWNRETDKSSCSVLIGAHAAVSFLTVERGNVFPGADALFEVPPCQQTGYLNS